MFPLGPSEICVSQLRAIEFLQKLGFQYLSSEEVAIERDGDFHSVLLKRILTAQLKRINRVNSQGEVRIVSDASVLKAIAMLNGAADSGSRLSHEKVYRHLLSGGSVEPVVSTNLGNSRINFIDWHHPLNNSFHVTADFCVRVGEGRTDRFVHIVCFVNGLPIVVIECSMTMGCDQLGDSRTRFSTNLQEGVFSRLFAFCQVFVGLEGDENGCLKVGPWNEDWVGWEDVGDRSEALKDLVNAPPEVADHHKLFSRRNALLKAEFERSSKRQVTGQDRILWNLCRPKYLMDHVRRFVCFDERGCVRNFARFPQYRVVEQLRDRVTKRGRGRRRKGGLIWYAGSVGKSQVMLFLGKSLALDSSLGGVRILFISERTDLLDWIESNFLSCGEGSVRLTSWEDIDGLNVEKGTKVFTMVSARLEDGLDIEKRNPEIGDELIILVDKGQRDLCSDSIPRTKSVFPNACFLVFSGSAPTKSEKLLARALGGYVRFRYSYRDALCDRAIVPIYYNNRSQWITRLERRDCLVRGLSSELMALGRTQTDCQSESKSLDGLFLLIACDLSNHYSQLWRGTGVRGLAIVSSESEGILLKSLLDRVGRVRSEISVAREGRSRGLDFDDSRLDGSDLPKQQDMDSEILIVLYKMIPLVLMARDCILYVIRWPAMNGLLQASTYLNCRCRGKDFALMVDYSSRSAKSGWLPILAELEGGFDRADLDGSLIDIDSVVGSLQDRLDSVWKLLSGNGSGTDDERLELVLADTAIRAGFLGAFFEFHRVLFLAHSSSRWTDETPDEAVRDYHEALVFFQSLRLRVASRYALDLDYAEFEHSLRELIAVRLPEPEMPLVLIPDDCLDREVFDTHLEQMVTRRAKADTIAYQTLRMILGRADEDPFYYREFSNGILQAIEARRSDQWNDVQYLKSVSHYLDMIRQGRRIVQGESRQASEFIAALSEVSRRTIGANLVDEVANDEWRFLDAKGPYEFLPPPHQPWDLWNVQVATQVLKLIRKHCRVGWRDSVDIQNRMRNEVDDYLFELQDQGGIKLSIAEMDEFIEASLEILKSIED